MHAFDPTGRHEGVVPATGHILKTLLLKCLNLVAPSKEGWLVSILARLIVIGGHPQNVLLGEFAGVPADSPQFFVSLLDHGNLQSFLFAHDQSAQEVDLLGSYLPIASEALLNFSDPQASVNDILFYLGTHSERFKETINHLLTRIVSQVNTTTE